MFVIHHRQRIPFFLRDDDWHDLVSQHTIGLRRSGFVLTVDCKRILVGTTDIEIDRHILGSFGHRIHTIQRLHLRIDEAPADGGVEDLRIA